MYHYLKYLILNKNICIQDESFFSTIKTNVTSTFIIIIQIFHLLLSITLISSNNKSSLILTSFSNTITLKFHKAGNFKIISSSFLNSHPYNKIIINKEIITEKIHTYNFKQTENIVELIRENNTDNCHGMFPDRNEISEIDLSHFDTSQVSDMYEMFCRCSSVTSINLSNFILKRGASMIKMFEGCSSLTSINFEKIGLTDVGMIHYMFSGCSSLSSLDLSNFNFFSNTDIEYIFTGCIHLEYINLKNFDGNGVKDHINHYNEFLYRVPDNVVIYDSGKFGDIINYKILNEKKCKRLITNDDSNWKSKQRKIIDSTGDCIDRCHLHSTHKYEYNGRCYENCSKGYITDDITGVIFCKCELDYCLHCPPVPLSKKLCAVCNYDYYPKEYDISNIGEYIKCYKDPIGYYLDYNASLYRKCYYTCEKCEIKGNNFTHNCQICKNNYVIEIEMNNYLNCYENCSFYHYYDKNKLYYCTNIIILVQKNIQI